VIDNKIKYILALMERGQIISIVCRFVILAKRWNVKMF